MIKLLHDNYSQLIDVANFDKEGLSFININTEEDLKIFTKGGIKCLA
jgi:molybdopterin-guanine dinucleotide biosynthesis protein A